MEQRADVVRMSCQGDFYAAGTAILGNCGAHVWMRHVTRMNDSCHTYEWDMSHIWMSHVAPRYWGIADILCLNVLPGRLLGSRHCDIGESDYYGDLYHGYAHSLVAFQPCLRQCRQRCSLVLLSLGMKCGVTRSFLCHRKSLCVAWLIHMCAPTHPYVCEDLFICVTWLLIWVPWLIHGTYRTHVNESRHSYNTHMNKSICTYRHISHTYRTHIAHIRMHTLEWYQFEARLGERGQQPTFVGCQLLPLCTRKSTCGVPQIILVCPFSPRRVAQGRGRRKRMCLPCVTRANLGSRACVVQSGKDP